MAKRTSNFKGKDPNVYPPGYDYQRVKAIADFYDAQTDEDAVMEIEIAIAAADSASSQARRKVPGKKRQEQPRTKK